MEHEHYTCTCMMASVPLKQLTTSTTGTITFLCALIFYLQQQPCMSTLNKRIMEDDIDNGVR